MTELLLGPLLPLETSLGGGGARSLPCVSSGEQRELPGEQHEPDAAFSLCHTHSAITILDLVGERKKEGRTLKGDLELKRVSCQGLNFILLLVVS